MRLLVIDLIPLITLLMTATIFLASRRMPFLFRTYKQLCVLALLFAFGNLAGNVWLQSGSQSTISSTSVTGLFAQDRLATIGQWASLLLGLLMAASIRERRLERPAAASCFGLLLLSVSGMLLASMAGDLVTLFVSLELAWLPAAYMPRTLSQTEQVSDATSKQRVIGLISSAFLLVGFLILYGLTGSIELSTIAGKLDQSSVLTDPMLAESGKSLLATLAAILIIASLGIRIPLAPFHFGFADIQAIIPSMSAAIRVAVAAGAAWILLLRLPALLAGTESTAQLLTLVLAIVSLAISIQGLLNETRLRRILTALILGQFGWILIAVSVAFWEQSRTGMAIGESSLLSFNAVTLALFAVMTTLLALAGFYSLLAYLDNENQPIEFLEELAGLIYHKPVAALAGSVLLLSLCGVPPLAGFWSKLFLAFSALSVQRQAVEASIPSLSPAFALVILLALVQGLVCVSTCLRIVSSLLFSAPQAAPQPGGSRSAQWMAAGCAVVLVAAGLYPAPVFDSLQGVGGVNAVADLSDERQLMSDSEPQPVSRTPLFETPNFELPEVGHQQTEHSSITNQQTPENTRISPTNPLKSFFRPLVAGSKFLTTGRYSITSVVGLRPPTTEF